MIFGTLEVFSFFALRRSEGVVGKSHKGKITDCGAVLNSTKLVSKCNLHYTITTNYTLH